jgi:hypothetical protein
MRFLSLLPVACLALFAAANDTAAQPQVINATASSRPAGGDLAKTFAALAREQTRPAWIGYLVPASEHGRSIGCGSTGSDFYQGRWNLEGGGTTRGWHTVTRLLEGPQNLLVLFRVEQREVGRIGAFSEDCQLDAGGLPFVWITGVDPAQSVALLATFVPDIGVEGPHQKPARPGRGALAAIAFHADAAADQAIDRFAAAGQPDRLRDQAVFWMGAARGRHGFESLRRMATREPAAKLREQITFALSLSGQQGAVETLVAMARSDATPRVRSQALFWLAQKAGKTAAGELTHAMENDPDVEVRKRAVFGLSRLPKDEAVPLLIKAARTSEHQEVRKQAIFWLGQTGDERALAFFEEILK